MFFVQNLHPHAYQKMTCKYDIKNVQKKNFISKFLLNYLKGKKKKFVIEVV